MLYAKFKPLGESHSEICPKFAIIYCNSQSSGGLFFVCHFLLEYLCILFSHDSLAGPALKPGKCLSWIWPYLDMELFSCRFLFHICLQSLPHCLYQSICLSSSDLKLFAPPSLIKCYWPLWIDESRLMGWWDQFQTCLAWNICLAVSNTHLEWTAAIEFTSTNPDHNICAHFSYIQLH